MLVQVGEERAESGSPQLTDFLGEPEHEIPEGKSGGTAAAETSTGSALKHCLLYGANSTFSQMPAQLLIMSSSRP